MDSDSHVTTSWLRRKRSGLSLGNEKMETLLDQAVTDPMVGSVTAVSTSTSASRAGKSTSELAMIT